MHHAIFLSCKKWSNSAMKSHNKCFAAGITFMGVILLVFLSTSVLPQVNRIATENLEEIQKVQTYTRPTPQPWNDTFGSNAQLKDLAVTEKAPDFKPVSDLGPLMYLYTAIWQADSVRITAIKTPKKPTKSIVCVLHYSSDLKSNFTTVKAFVKNLPNYGSKNTSAYIKCPVEGEWKARVPLYVGLVTASNASVAPDLFLPVELRQFDPAKVDRYPLARMRKENGPGLPHGGLEDRVVEFTVCVPAMFNYSNAAQMVEKLEMMRLMGAGRVVLYEHSIGDNVRAVLKYYMQEWSSGRETLQVELRSWKIPFVGVHYLGQLGAVDDCLHRYGWLSHYMIFDDLDEVIFPFHHDTWSQFVAAKEKSNPTAAAFLFIMSVTNKDHTSPALGFEIEAYRYQSSVLAFTKRDDHFFEAGNKSKLIVKPKKVQAMDVHEAFEATGPTEILNVKEGMLYHFRWPNRPCKGEVEDTRLVDKYGKRLVVRLEAIWSKLKGVDFGSDHPKVGASRISCKGLKNDTVSTVNASV